MDSTLGNKIWLKPRFKLLVDKPLAEVKSKFEERLSQKPLGFKTKIVDNHIVIDVPKEDAHVWSPQLQIELVYENEKTSVKGLYGPKPQLWTFFMMIHFAMAIVFAVFAVLSYSQYSLGKNYKTSLFICLGITILWVLFYILGQLGKRKGHTQMLAMDNFVKSIIHFTA